MFQLRGVSKTVSRRFRQQSIDNVGQFGRHVAVDFIHRPMVVDANAIQNCQSLFRRHVKRCASDDSGTRKCRIVDGLSQSEV